MKKFIIVLVIAAVFVPAAYAHSPSAITVKTINETVEVFISHPVSDPIEHYIRLVTISINGKEVQSREFTTQSAEGLAVTFDIPGLKSQDKVIVFAVCNRFGDKRQEVTVP